MNDLLSNFQNVETFFKYRKILFYKRLIFLQFALWRLKLFVVENHKVRIATSIKIRRALPFPIKFIVDLIKNLPSYQTYLCALSFLDVSFFPSKHI